MDERLDSATQEMMRVNERNWDSRTPVHVASEFYGLDTGRDPFDWFAPFEWDDLGDLRGHDVLHLQCHLGTETVAFARQGAASTVGLDISAESIEQARRLAREAGDNVDYVRANVYDAVHAVQKRRFDVVYTGKGSLVYLPDLARWAEVVSELLRPGGQVYIVEFHPMLNALGPVLRDGEDEELLLRHDYLEGRGYMERDSTFTYTDGPAVQGATTAYEWQHGLGEVVNALLGSGLRLTTLRETELLPWRRWPSMVRADNGWWQLPPEAPRIPLLFAAGAAKPA